MKTLIVCCSHRPNSNSLKVSQTIEALLTHSESSQIFDLLSMPLWQEQMWQPSSPEQQAVQPFIEAVTEADSLIWVVPEYAGMASPASKNALLMLNTEAAGHKPSLLVSVSAGPAGSYPIAELRMSSYKNNRLLWIPDHVIIRYADEFNPPYKDLVQEQAYKRLQYSLKLLKQYSLALEKVRQSGVLAEQPYPFGV